MIAAHDCKEVLRHQWQLVTLADATTARITENHIVPVNDLREHESSNCWCVPERDDEAGAELEGPLWIHNSLDRREQFEALPLQ